MFDLAGSDPPATARAAPCGDPFADLNSAQLEAVTHRGGPLLVLAGAGTGKTTTLAARVASLVAEGADPQRILLLTFTRRAAAEMRSRADRMLARTAAARTGATAGRVVGGTFHAVANRLLRQSAHRIGLAPDFGLLDAADAADLLDMVRDDLGVARGTSRFPQRATLAAIYSRVVNARTPLQATLEERFPWCAEHREAIARVFTEYSARKRARDLLDYDDLLLHMKVLAEAPGAGDALADAFDHVLVDEYQDVNALQAEIVRALRRRNDDVTAVGDDAQAVYGFRAADVRHILGFPDAFPGTRVVRLERSYRSTQPILDTANAVLAEMPQARRPGFARQLFSARVEGPRPRLHTCHDEADQSARVCEAVLERREQGTPLQQQAVLVRTGHHSAHLELELARRGIPFVKFGGLKYLEAAHVKDLIALLRLLDHDTDELAWFRILQRLEGIGPRRARALLAAITAAGDDRALTRLAQGPAALGVDLPAVAATAVAELGTALVEAAATPVVAGQIQRLRTWYAPVCDLAFDDAPSRLADLEQLEVLAGDLTDRTRFLDDLVLDPPASTGDLAGPPLLDEDWLVVSTIHSAKGLEWDAVHLLHAADGMIPSDMATGGRGAGGPDDELEEERRLLYVALTRARAELDVYVPLRYHHQRFGGSDRHSFGQVSRFLQGPVRDTMDRVGPRARQDDVPALAGGAAASVEALLQDLW